jgi:hypothetical protein
MKNVLLAILAVSFLAFNAEARRDQNREQRQQQRIKSGVKSKELTVGEAKRLRKGQKHIDKMQRKFKADDGVVDAKEKARLEHAQDKQSAKIYKLKHNDNQRGDGQPGNPGNPQPPTTSPVEPQPAPAPETPANG